MKFQAHYFGGTRLVSPYGANSTLQKNPTLSDIIICSGIL